MEFWSIFENFVRRYIVHVHTFYLHIPRIQGDSFFRFTKLDTISWELIRSVLLVKKILITIKSYQKIALRFSVFNFLKNFAFLLSYVHTYVYMYRHEHTLLPNNNNTKVNRHRLCDSLKVVTSLENVLGANFPWMWSYIWRVFAVPSLHPTYHHHSLNNESKLVTAALWHICIQDIGKTCDV